MSTETTPQPPEPVNLWQVYANTAAVARVPVYAYGEIVRARPATYCIAFERTVREGRQDVDMVVTAPGDWLVTSDQETRIASRDEIKQFRQLPDGMYMRVRYLIKAFQNPLGVPVVTTGQAGEEITGSRDCMFVMKVPGSRREPSSYAGFIEPAQFHATCRPYDEVYGRPFDQRTFIKRIAHRMQQVRGLRWLAGKALSNTS